MFDGNINYEPTVRHMSHGRVLSTALAIATSLALVGCNSPRIQDNSEGVFATSRLCRPGTDGRIVTDVFFIKISGVIPKGGLHIRTKILDNEDGREKLLYADELDYAPDIHLPRQFLIYSGTESPRTIRVDARTVRPDGREFSVYLVRISPSLHKCR